MRINDPKPDIVRDFRRLPRQNAASSPLGNSSVSKGALVVRSAEGLQVEGSERITGIWYLEGVGYVLGTLEGSGDLHWTGPVDIDGTLSVNDDATLNAGLTLGSSGRIYVGPITLDPVGSGGQISSSGFLRLVAATGFQFQGNGTLTGNLGVTGSFSAGSKSFKIPHPLVPGAWLMHGSTESPVHGVEYWGDAVLDAGGSATVELPDYFEVLTQHAGRALFVTGRGFAADWTDIAAGVFTVSGPSGGRFSWLVKAARADVLFDPVTPMSADEAVAAVDEEDD